MYRGCEPPAENVAAILATFDTIALRCRYERRVHWSATPADLLAHRRAADVGGHRAIWVHPRRRRLRLQPRHFDPMIQQPRGKPRRRQIGSGVILGEQPPKLSRTARCSLAGGTVGVDGAATAEPPDTASNDAANATATAKLRWRCTRMDTPCVVVEDAPDTATDTRRTGQQAQFSNRGTEGFSATRVNISTTSEIDRHIYRHSRTNSAQQLT